MFPGSRAERLACAVLCAASSIVVAHRALPRPAPVEQTGKSQITTAYVDGRLVSFQLAPVPRGAQGVQVGPWHFGEKVPYPTHRDRRLNLYLAAPGSQHRVPGEDAYSHNDVINSMPATRNPVEWDVYWAVVLDPSMTQEFQKEADLLHATQKEFHPGESFRFEEIPGAAFLRDIMNIGTLQALERHRRPSGNLPQVLILPAGFAVLASVGELPSGSALNRQ